MEANIIFLLMLHQKRLRKLREDYNIPRETIHIKLFQNQEDYEIELPFKIDEYEYSYKRRI